MSKSDNLLIHALAIHPENDTSVRMRATIRTGNPVAGHNIWFEGTDRIRRTLQVVDIKRSDRLSTISVQGKAEDLQHLVGGTYLYGNSGEDQV